jgi:DNA-binding GntR family transcriptional regulator
MSVTDQRNRPRRRALVDEIRDLIAREYVFSGSVAAGQLLPSEKALAERYSVSRVTLRAAMRSLQEAGLISSRHGVGWSLTTNPSVLVPGLDQLSSLETFAQEAGKVLTTEQLAYEELTADEHLARTLEVPLRHAVLAIRRVKVMDGKPVAWLVDYVPAGLLAFDTIRSEFAGSVLDILLEHAEVALEFADTEMQPVNLAEEIARSLRVKPGTAALFTNSIARSSSDRVVEWAQGWLLPEHLRFRVRRRRRIGQ